MTGEWIALNGITEREEEVNPDFPWYPSLCIDNGAIWPSLEIWFATEEECLQFIEDHVLGATLEEQ